MSFKIDLGQPLNDQLFQLARKQLDKAQGALRDEELAPSERIYAVRKRFKKLRGFYRLVCRRNDRFRANENVRLRDAARLVSTRRDDAARLDAFVELFDGLPGITVDDFHALHTMLKARCERPVVQDDKGLIKALDKACAQHRREMSAYFQSDRSIRSVDQMAEGFARVYKRAREQLKLALASHEEDDFHELRKHLKYHRMHLRLLRDIKACDERFLPAQKIAASIGKSRDLSMLVDFCKQDAIVEVDGNINWLIVAADVKAALLKQEALGGAKTLLEPTVKALTKPLRARTDAVV